MIDDRKADLAKHRYAPRSCKRCDVVGARDHKPKSVQWQNIRRVLVPTQQHSIVFAGNEVNEYVNVDEPTNRVCFPI